MWSLAPAVQHSTQGPAEVAALLDLAPDQDVLTWCLRHPMPSRPGGGLEPEFAAGPVLALAHNAAWPDSAVSD